MKCDKTCYDYSRERDIHWVHPGMRPAYLRECLGHLPAGESEYVKPSIQPHADLWGWAIVDPHNLPRVTRCFFLLTNVRDGDIDVRHAAQNTYTNDRLVDPFSIEAGKPSKSATPRRADRHARRTIKQRRVYHSNAQAFRQNNFRWPKSAWQYVKRWLGVRYA